MNNEDIIQCGRITPRLCVVDDVGSGGCSEGEEHSMEEEVEAMFRDVTHFTLVSEDIENRLQ